MHAQRRIALVTVCALLGTVGIAGCAPQANEALATDDRQAAQAEERNYTDEQKSIIAGEEGTTYDGISLDAYPGKGYLDDMHDMWTRTSINGRPSCARCRAARSCSAPPAS